MEVITEVTQSHYELFVFLGIIVTCVVVIFNIKKMRSNWLDDQKGIDDKYFEKNQHEKYESRN